MGQTDSDGKADKDSTWNDWNVRLSPYVWLLGIKGQIAVTPAPVQLPNLPPPIDQLPSGRSIYDIDFSAREAFFSGSLQGAIVKIGFQF